jgi:competence protein ComEC
MAVRNFFWGHVPFLRLLTGVIAGILLGIYLNVVPIFIAWTVVGIFALLLNIVIFNKNFFSSYRYRWLPGVLIYFLTVFLFYIITLEKTTINYPNHFSKNIFRAEGFIGYISEEPIEKAKSRKTEIEITSVRIDSSWISCAGKCLLYISRDSLSSKLGYGDVIAFTTVPSETSPPQNPSQFNYKQYLAFHQVYHQVYLASGKWIPLKIKDGSELKRVALGVRKKLLKIYSENNISGQELAVLSSLTLGYTDDIDEETQQAFAASGALHVLSVSGLHVGIVVYALSLLLFFLDKGKRNKIIKTLLLIIFIWAYALVTGLSAAVLRAAVMFTVIILGKAFLRQTNIFNAIAVSAVILLIFNPYLIMEVGFQLSYLALIGIVAIHPWLYRQLYVKNWLLDKVWELTSVSIAAQLATFPLGLLYFQQFPNGFLLSNLIVIPVSNLIIFGGLGMLFVNLFSSSAAALVAIPVKYVTLLLNQIVLRIEKVPYSYVPGISVNIFQTWLIYFIIIAICVFVIKKNVVWLSVSFLLMVFFLGSWLYDSIQIGKQREMIVYSVNGKSAVQFTQGRSAVLFASNDLLSNPSSMRFNINRNIYDSGVTNLQQIGLDSLHITNETGMFYKNGFLYFEGKKYFLADGSQDFNKSSSMRIAVDVVIVSGKSIRNISALTSHFSFKELIMDASVPKWLAKKLIAEAAFENISCYSVTDKGAYVLKKY